MNEFTKNFVNQLETKLAENSETIDRLQLENTGLKNALNELKNLGG